MLMFNYVALTLCQRQHPYDILFPLKVNKVTSQKGILKRVGKISKEYDITWKSVSVTLTRHEWGWYRI